MEETVIATMKQLGFNASEARIYIALVKACPATGYELAARSGVPRSAIYNLLRRLEARGVVSALAGKPARYMPLPPEQLCDRLRGRMTRDLDQLSSALAGLSTTDSAVSTWPVLGYQEQLERARAMVSSAQRLVFASLWRREASALADAFAAAEQRGVEVVLFSFTTLPDGLGRCFSYGIDETALEAHWPHRLLLLADDREVLIGDAADVANSRAIVAREPALIEIVRSNLVLDLTLYGQRTGEDVHDVITHLTSHLAPIDQLLP